MDTLDTTIMLIQNIQDNFKLLPSSVSTSDLHRSITDSLLSANENLLDCKSQIKGSYQIMDNLLKERDILLAKPSIDIGNDDNDDEHAFS